TLDVEWPSPRVAGRGWPKAGEGRCNHRDQTSYHPPEDLTMITLFALAAGFAVLCIVAVIGIALIKVAFKLVLLPVKLLALPFILIAVMVKLVLVFALGVTLVALLIPAIILGTLFVGPFLILAAVR